MSLFRFYFRASINKCIIINGYKLNKTIGPWGEFKAAFEPFHSKAFFQKNRNKEAVIDPPPEQQQKWTQEKKVLIHVNIVI